jgi:hypothetical protein
LVLNSLVSTVFYECWHKMSNLPQISQNNAGNRKRFSPIITPIETKIC